MHSLEKFKAISDNIVVVVNENDLEEIKLCHDNVVLGGTTRQDSVYAGVQKCQYDKILIHDGARPFISEDDINRMVEASNTVDLAFLGNTLIDSIKDLEYNNLNRDEFIITYTPQLINKAKYLEAYKKSTRTYSDDVSLVCEELGIKPKLIFGDRNNIKITTKEDYVYALEKVSRYRIGHSWDVHKLVVDRKLILGGVEIPYEKGLLGHSDADALLHAISEGLLGALSLGDLGTHFPDNDPKYKGIDSKLILKECYQKVLDAGYVIGNIDTMIYIEAPKMKPYIYLMRETISELLNIDIMQISIKATTYEKMDAIGRGEAIACDSTVLLYERYKR
jgi:2-C-methyl-D-erythritol 2,4-cyclodiphosphate synthase/2-C-methyl-D-erythritol 4-phosphate cytidylyltransferase